MLSKKHSTLILCGIFVIMLAARLMSFVGLIGSDDLTYNRSAYEVVQGVFSPQLNHQQTRLGLIFPVALIFRLFGIHEISSVTFPLICAIATFWLLVYAGSRYWGVWGGIVAGVLYTFLPIEILQATQLLPDLPAATCLTGSAILLEQIETNHNQAQHSSFWGMLCAGILFGWAYLIKETSVFFGVFVAGYFSYQMAVRKNFCLSWLWYAIGAALMIGLECGYYYRTTGTPWYRYLSVVSGHNVSVFSGQMFHGWALVRRLALDQLQMLFQVQHFSFYFVGILAGVVYGVQRWRTPHVGFLLGWFGSLFLLFNFGSTSLTAYMPLAFFPRFFVALSAPGILILTWYLLEMRFFLDMDKPPMLCPVQVALLIPLGLLALIAVLWPSWPLMVFGVGMAVLLAIVLSQRLRAGIRKRLPAQYAALVLPVAFCYLSLMPGIYYTAKGENPFRGLTCERELRTGLGSPLSRPIHTDQRTAAILQYLYQYQQDERILSFEDANVRTVQAAYVIVNWERLFFLERLYAAPIPDLLYHPPASWILRVQLGGDVNPCLVYEVP